MKVRASAYESVGDTNIQSIAEQIWKEEGGMHGMVSYSGENTVLAAASQHPHSPNPPLQLIVSKNKTQGVKKNDCNMSEI